MYFFSLIKKKKKRKNILQQKKKEKEKHLNLAIRNCVCVNKKKRLEERGPPQLERTP